MSTAEEYLPALSAEVAISDVDAKGRRVIKHTRKGTYLHAGREESFLLARFDGKTTYGAVIKSFNDRFAEPITRDDIDAFVGIVKKKGLIARRGKRKEDCVEREVDSRSFLRRCWEQARRQSALYFRISLVNPNRSLDWLEPKTRWLFSPVTAFVAGALGLVAMFVTWANWSELLAQFSSLLSLQSLVVFWLTIFVVTICHEYGHGLACKRYGGEVREMGLLWIFFMPCFYCNVSDAWLLPSRKRRILISMAGTYVDFLIWIGAVFAWRLAARETWLSLATWIIITTCGLRVAFNLNPLLRMDGYYALSDACGVHNLRARARSRLMEWTRWIFWGAPRPRTIEDGRVLLAYGLISWFFVVGLMALISFQLSSFLRPFLGVAGLITAGTFFVAISRRYFKGSLGEDFKIMFSSKKWRVLIWIALIVGICMIPITDRAGGEFFVRPMVHCEVRAPVAGFLRELKAEQNDTVEAGQVIAILEIPELTSQIARKKLEIAETEAILRKLRCGPRPEAVVEQRAKIDRATRWRDLAEKDLAKAVERFDSEIAAFDFRLERANTDLKFRSTISKQAQQLHDKGGLAGQQLLAIQRLFQESKSELKQIEAEKSARAAQGVLVAQAELARREKELADHISDMTLMAAGTRPEEIEAAEAKLRRLKEEQRHFLEQQTKQTVVCAVGGTVTTPRLREKVGQYLERGSQICIVEDLREMEAEIAVSEHDTYILQPGQRVTLRPRALPFNDITGTVDRVAPATNSKAPGTTVAAAAINTPKQTSLAVYCHVDNPDEILRTGMTGFARVHADERRLGGFVMNKALRLVRAEFWW